MPSSDFLLAFKIGIECYLAHGLLAISRGPLQPGRWRADMPPGRTQRAACPRGGPFPSPRLRGPRFGRAGSRRGGGTGGAGAGGPPQAVREAESVEGRIAVLDSPPKCTGKFSAPSYAVDSLPLG